jgi:hemerythrin
MVEWSDSLATGILWQDFQHAGLIARINRLHQAIINRQSDSELRSTLDFLESYIENHFTLEERYMEALHDPELREHARAHQQFRDNLGELRTCKDTGAQLTASSLCYDLHEWITHHIRTIDKRLGRLIREQGIDRG